jgi:predicted enzyme related to lactoylglutathione lyase
VPWRDDRRVTEPVTFLSCRANLEVVDAAPTIAFFNDVLGWTTHTTMGDPVWFAIIGSHDASLAIVGTADPAVPRSNASCYLEVDDVVAAHHACTGAGSDATPLETHPWGMTDFTVTEPGGHRLAIGQRTGSAT